MGSEAEIPCYNIKSSAEKSPAFYALSRRIVEMLLESFADLDVTAEYGMPLLWKCAHWGGVSERVARHERLAEQYGQRWSGTLPLETGRAGRQHSFNANFIRAIHFSHVQSAC